MNHRRPLRPPWLDCIPHFGLIPTIYPRSRGRKQINLVITLAWLWQVAPQQSVSQSPSHSSGTYRIAYSIGWAASSYIEYVHVCMTPSGLITPWIQALASGRRSSPLSHPSRQDQCTPRGFALMVPDVDSFVHPDKSWIISARVSRSIPASCGHTIPVTAASPLPIP